VAQTNWRAVAHQAAVKAGHPDPAMFVRQMLAESGLRPGQTSSAGAQGIAQIMPATARGWGVDPNDPHAALAAAAGAMTKYIKSYGGDYAKALAAYNAGTGAVAKYGGVPPFKETQNYVKKILGGKGGHAPAQPKVPGAAPAPKQSYGLQAAGPSAASSLLEDGFLKRYMERQSTAVNQPAQTAPAASGGGPGHVPTGKGVPARRPGEPGWRYLQRIGSSLFGLRNDPGNSQTTGGKHAAGSPHYDGRAIDFGDARNTRAQLDAWAKYLRENYDALGLERVIWQEKGHFNHVDAATKRSSKPVNKIKELP
jgi:hypothetical protein